MSDVKAQKEKIYIKLAQKLENTEREHGESIPGMENIKVAGTIDYNLVDNRSTQEKLAYLVKSRTGKLTLRDMLTRYDNF